MRSSEMGMDVLEKPEIEKVGKPERQKIKNALKEEKRKVSVIENYLALLQVCDDQEININDQRALEKLRYPNTPVSQDSNLGKILKVNSGQAEMGGNLTEDQVDQIYSKIIVPFKVWRGFTLPQILLFNDDSGDEE